MAAGAVAEPVAAKAAPKPAEKSAAPTIKPGTAGEPSADNEEARWRPVLGLPCELAVDLSLPHFTVADMLKLRAGSVVGTNWNMTRDVPLRVNGTLIGWSEFEVVGSRLAVRLTELA